MTYELYVYDSSKTQPGNMISRKKGFRSAAQAEAYFFSSSHSHLSYYVYDEFGTVVSSN